MQYIIFRKHITFQSTKPFSLVDVLEERLYLLTQDRSKEVREDGTGVSKNAVSMKFSRYAVAYD